MLNEFLALVGLALVSLIETGFCISLIYRKEFPRSRFFYVTDEDEGVHLRLTRLVAS
jgi:hypothetical protein